MPTKSLVILNVAMMVIATIFVVLAGIPGVNATKRAHPQAKAINILGWVGLPLGIAPWLIALVWSNMNPLSQTTDLEANVQPSAETEDDTSAAT